MFDQMLGIKRFREQQAELALMRQRQRRANAVREADEAQNRLATYRDWAKEQEQSMYRDLCNRIVRPRDIENVLSEVAGLRRDESDYASVWRSASETVDLETQVLGECRNAHELTVKSTKKFTEVAEVYWDDLAQMQNKKEDNELEEIASLSRGGADWTSSESEFI